MLAEKCFTWVKFPMKKKVQINKICPHIEAHARKMHATLKSYERLHAFSTTERHHSSEIEQIHAKSKNFTNLMLYKKTQFSKFTNI